MEKENPLKKMTLAELIILYEFLRRQWMENSDYAAKDQSFPVWDEIEERREKLPRKED